jgi:hypothetical protein
MSWQPIATAPHDALILLYRPGTRYPWAQVDIGRWDDNHYAKKPRPFWRSMNGLLGITEMRDYFPSHWQPLPVLPSPQAGEGEES